MQTNNHLVIMAGGVGSRFWPMSTAERPKQFIDVLGVGRSLLQLTVERFRGICPPENVWVLTNQRYADLASGHEGQPCYCSFKFFAHSLLPHCILVDSKTT